MYNLVSTIKKDRREKNRKKVLDKHNRGRVKLN